MLELPTMKAKTLWGRLSLSSSPLSKPSVKSWDFFLLEYLLEARFSSVFFEQRC